MITKGIDMLIWPILLITGLCAGVLSGLFGVGGGLIIVPALVLFLHMTQHTASALSLVALMLPLGPAIAVYQYYHAGKINTQHFLYGVLICIGLAVGAYFGSKLALSLDQKMLQRSFAIFLVFAAALIWWRTT